MAAATAAFGEVALLNALVPGAAYVAGVERARRTGHAWPARRSATFLGALLLLAAATSGAVDQRVDRSLAWHMSQQMTLVVLVPLGLLAGRPDEMLRRPRDAWRKASGPAALAAAWLAFAGIQWVVHVPAVLDATLRHEALRPTAHWAAVAAGIAFFGCALAAPASGRLHPLPAALYVVSVMPVTDAIALWLMFDPHVIYERYAGAGGIADQRAAGAVMFAAGSVPLLVAAGITYAWARRDRARSTG